MAEAVVAAALSHEHSFKLSNLSITARVPRVITSHSRLHTALTKDTKPHNTQQTEQFKNKNTVGYKIKKLMKNVCSILEAADLRKSDVCVTLKSTLNFG